jgi:hypothetical protein
MTCVIACAVCLVAGFGAGRVKNAKKLAAVQAELDKAKGIVVAEVKKVV